MKIDQLYQVMEIAETGSINQAAKNLFIAQSSLSTSVKSLEEELDVRIFDRVHNKIHLTNSGKSFLILCQKMIEDYENMLNITHGKKLYANENFGISVYFLSFANIIFSQLCNKYHDRGINFSFREESRMDIILSVNKGRSELGFLSMPSINENKWKALMHAYDLEYHKISDEAATLMFGEPTELYQNPPAEISRSFLEGKRMVIIEESNEVFNEMNNRIIEIFQPSSLLRLCDRASLSDVLHNQDLYFVGSKNKSAYPTEQSFYAGIHTSTVNDLDYQYEIGYVKKHGAHLSPLGAEYLHMMRSVMGLV